MKLIVFRKFCSEVDFYLWIFAYIKAFNTYKKFLQTQTQNIIFYSKSI